MCEFGFDYGEQESGRGFYQTTRMSFTDLKFAVEQRRKGISVAVQPPARRSAFENLVGAILRIVPQKRRRLYDGHF